MSEIFERWKTANGHMALSQATHEAINARHYPGTRQLCTECDAPTGRCEDDTLIADVGPLCEECWDKPERHAEREGLCPACNRDMDRGEPHTAECASALAQDDADAAR